MRVAAKAKRLSRKMLERCTELFTPDTVMRWYRDLISEKYNGSQNRTYAGRPPIAQEIVNLVIRFKEENPRWGYQKITDQIVYLGHKISKSSVKNILIENGYDEKFSVGIMTTAPNLGIIIPPSIAMILYAMVSNDPIEALFLTGFIPGIMIMVAMSLYAYFYCKRRNYKTLDRPSFKEIITVLKESFWALCLPLLIFGGIYSGMFTANEAAVVACFYAFFVEIFIHKDMKIKDVKQVIVSSSVTSATLLIIVAGASVFGEYLTFEQIPDKIANAVVSQISSPWVFLLAVNVMLLIVGMFMDIISATLILTPIFLPLLASFGIDTMHFGLLMNSKKTWIIGSRVLEMQDQWKVTLKY